jgi:hypothetical protein
MSANTIGTESGISEWSDGHVGSPVCGLEKSFRVAAKSRKVVKRDFRGSKRLLVRALLGVGG